MIVNIDNIAQIEDARVAMRLYQTHKKKWESMLKAKRRRKGKGQ